MVDDITKSLTIEMHSMRFKSIVLICSYRTPSSCVEQFIITDAIIFTKIYIRRNYILINSRYF